jgi:DNA transformation protein
MNELTKEPNIGKTLAVKLSEAGISNINELRSTGSEKAFIRIKTIDSEACINMLYAIEGAIQGIRWHGLPKERKQELKDFFNSIQ